MVLAVGVWLVACHQATKPAPTASASPPTLSAPDPAVEVAAVIKRDVRIANACSSADCEWATCDDETLNGFDALKKCADDAAKACRAAQKSFVAPNAKDACAQEVEKKT